MPATHTPLSPIDFIERIASAYPNTTDIIYDDLQHNNQRHTWSETFFRYRQMADAVSKLGLGK